MAPVGAGATSLVYRGLDVALDRPVALKFMRGDETARGVERFIREGRALARLVHPNVVQVYRVGSAEGRPYLAYEFVEGTSLAAIAKPLEWRRVLEIAIGIAKGLEAVHRSGFLHRDLKPANIVLTREGLPKIIDFGLAVQVDELGADIARPPSGTLGVEGASVEAANFDEARREGARVDPNIDSTSLGMHSVPDDSHPRDSILSNSTAPNSPLRGSPPVRSASTISDSSRSDPTSSSAHRSPRPESGGGELDDGRDRLVGTPQYMAPELFHARRASVQSEIYSVGLILRELLSGESLRRHSDWEAVVRDACESTPALLRAPGVPISLLDTIARCLSAEPSARFGSAEELIKSLEIVRSYFPSGALTGSVDPTSDCGLVAASFARIAERGDAFVGRFYEILFALDRRIRPLFPRDLHGQRQKLLHALDSALTLLRSPQLLTPMLEDLGRRHAAYGIAPAHVDIAEHALLAAIRQYDDELSPETEAAWAHALASMFDAFLRGLSSLEVESAETVLPSVDLPRVESPVVEFHMAGTSLAFGVSGDRERDTSRVVPHARFLSSNGVMIAYQTVGEGSESILLIPGLVHHIERAWQHSHFASWTANLAKRGRLTIVDRRGVGLSDRAARTYSLAEQVEDLIAVIDSVDVERTWLLTTSDAAPLAIALAAMHPARVRGVVLDAPVVGVSSPNDPIRDIELDWLNASWGGPALLDRVAPRWASNLEQIRAWAAWIRNGSSPSWLVQWRAHARSLEIEPLARRVPVPVYLFRRSEDRFESHNPELARWLGAAEIRFDGAEHLAAACDAAPWFDAFDRVLAAHRGEDAPCELMLTPLRVVVTVFGGVEVVAATRRIIGATYGHPTQALRSALATRLAVLNQTGHAPSIALGTGSGPVFAIPSRVTVMEPLGSLLAGSEFGLERVPGAKPARWWVASG